MFSAAGLKLTCPTFLRCVSGVDGREEREGERKGGGDVPRVAGQLRDGADVGHILGVDMEGEVLGDLPDKDLAVVRPGRDDIVIEGVPTQQPPLAPPRMVCAQSSEPLKRRTSRCPGQSRCGP